MINAKKHNRILYGNSATDLYQSLKNIQATAPATADQKFVFTRDAYREYASIIEKQFENTLILLRESEDAGLINIANDYMILKEWLNSHSAPPEKFLPIHEPEAFGEENPDVEVFDITHIHSSQTINTIETPRYQLRSGLYQHLYALKQLAFH